MTELRQLLSPFDRRQLTLDMEQMASEGANEADLRDYAQGYKDGYSGSSGVGGLVGKLAQGALLGYADEAKGWVQSKLTGRSRLYETGKVRAELARTSREAPASSMAAEVAGSIAPSVVGGIGLAGALGRAASVGGNIARGVAGGAALGGIYGSGNEVGGPGERALGAVEGGVVGGLTGLVVTPLSELALGAGRRIGAALSARGGDAQAGRALRGAIESSGGNATTISSRMAQAQADGVPMTLAEGVGQQGVDLLEAAAQAPGPGREQIVQQLGERQMAQPGRLVEALRSASGVTRGSVDTAEAARSARAAAARPLYENLGGIDMPDDLMGHFWSFLQTKAGRSAYSRAADFAQQAKVRGEPFGQLPSYEALKKGARLTVGEADVILQGLESAAERKMAPALVPGGKSATKDSIAYNKTAEFLRKRMEAMIPEFEAARATWAGPTQFIESIRQGEKALGMDLDTFKTVFAKSNAAQQEGMKIGLVNSLKSDLEQYAAGPTADASRNLAKRFAVREKLRMVLGGQADDLLRAIDTEAQTSATANQVTGNSATARRQAAGEALGDEALDGSPVSAQGIIRRIVGKIDQWAQRNTRDAIARLGLTTDPAEAARLVQGILDGPPSRPRGTIPGAVIGAPAGAAGAAVADR